MNNVNPYRGDIRTTSGRGVTDECSDTSEIRNLAHKSRYTPGSRQ